LIRADSLEPARLLKLFMALTSALRPRVAQVDIATASSPTPNGLQRDHDAGRLDDRTRGIAPWPP